MQVSFSWLKEYAAIKLPTDKLADKLAMHGLEVEQIIDRRHDFDKVVVGQVLGVKPHPNADKLRLVTVRVKAGGQLQEIVCGAPNVATGQKVAVALLGAKLPNGMTIESRAIRGVTSQGMICAEDELGLGTDHQGIIVLDKGFSVGMPLAKALDLDEPVLDIAIPANRPDLLSVIGLAREIAAILGVKFIEPKEVQPTGKNVKSKSVAVKIPDQKLCPVYTAHIIRGVTIKPSPASIQNILRAAGIRPINNIVDATNFIMLKCDQPLHAFDAIKVKGEITVRPAKVGETLVTLDKQKRQLDTSMLVIADANGPIALAGVMGGAESEISANTTDVILESAIFDPVSIRRTSRRLGLVSEASKRFEKGLPVDLPLTAGQTAAKLIVELSGGKIEPGAAVTGNIKAKPVVIAISSKYFTELLGQPVTPARAKKILSSLGFKVGGTAKQWKVTAPSWRLDIAWPADIVDEVGRLMGYEAIPKSLPSVNTVPEPIPPLIKLKEAIRDTLAGIGFTEVITHTYYGQPWAEKNSGQHFEIANPLDKAQHYLRKSLLQQMQSVIEHEVDAGHNCKIFQIGRTFDPSLHSPIEQQQPWKLCLGIAFKPEAGYVEGRKIIGAIEVVSRMLNIGGRPLESVEVIKLKGRLIELCEIDVKELDRQSGSTKKRFAGLNNQPGVKRDLSAFISDKVKFPEILEAIGKTIAGGQSLLDLSATHADWYRHEGKTSVTLHLTFRAADRTLTKDEVDKEMNKISEALIHLGAKVR